MFSSYGEALMVLLYSSETWELISADELRLHGVGSNI